MSTCHGRVSTDDVLAEVALVRRGVRASHARLHRTAALLDERRMRERSRLPDWSRGHLLTHLARNADSVVRRIQAAAQDELIDQYAGGEAGRAAEIEHGALRPPDQITADLRAADDVLDVLDVPTKTWSRQVRRGSGKASVLLSAADLLWSRWREIEVHHLDLGLGHSIEDWPQPLVSWMLPRLLEALPERAAQQQLAAWALDRGPAPHLRPWGG